MIKIGDAFPDATLTESTEFGDACPLPPKKLSAAEMAKGKKLVIFGLPGAYTPTCSNEQCPGFERLYGDFAAEGVTDIHCISVNDAFVMYNWGKNLGVQNVKMVPDGSGAFTRRMGMLINKDHVGFGMRSWRYTAIVDDGVVVQMFVEPGINDVGTDADPYVESTPEKALEWVKANPYQGKLSQAA